MSNGPIDHYDDDKTGRNRSVRLIEHREKIALREIDKLKIGSAQVLDIGSGNGIFLRALRDHSLQDFQKFYGIDYSAFEVAKAQKDHANNGIVFQQSDVEQGIKFPDEHFNLVYSGEVIEHLYNPDKFLDEISRILIPSGYVVITTPNMFAWYNRILAILGIQPIFYEASVRSSKIGFGFLKSIKKEDIPAGHIRLLTKRALIDLIAESGLEIISLHGSVFEGFPKPIKFIDKLFCLLPGLSSGFVMVAQKRPHS